MVIVMAIMALSILAIIIGAILTSFPRRQKCGAMIVIIGCVTFGVSIIEILDFVAKILCNFFS